MCARGNMEKENVRRTTYARGSMEEENVR